MTTKAQQAGGGASSSSSFAVSTAATSEGSFVAASELQQINHEVHRLISYRLNSSRDIPSRDLHTQVMSLVGRADAVKESVLEIDDEFYEKYLSTCSKIMAIREVKALAMGQEFQDNQALKFVLNEQMLVPYFLKMQTKDLAQVRDESIAMFFATCGNSRYFDLLINSYLYFAQNKVLSQDAHRQCLQAFSRCLYDMEKVMPAHINLPDITTWIVSLMAQKVSSEMSNRDREDWRHEICLLQTRLGWFPSTRQSVETKQAMTQLIQALRLNQD